MPVEKRKAEALRWKNQAPFAKVVLFVPTKLQKQRGPVRCLILTPEQMASRPLERGGNRSEGREDEGRKDGALLMEE